MRAFIFLLSLSLLFCSCNKKEEDPSLPDNLLIFYQEVNNSTADDIHYNKILLTLDRDYLNLVPSVTLSTSLGTFQNTVLNFDTLGRAYAYLRSPKPGTAQISVVIKNVGFYTSCSFTPASSYFTTNTLRDFSAADGYEVNVIELLLKPGYTGLVNSATVSTSVGSLVQNTVNFDPAGKAYIYLKSTEPGNAVVNITTKETNVALNSNFKLSFPSQLNINTAASMTNRLEEKLNVSVSLKKDLGKVSSNIPIYIIAKDEQGNKKGSFYNVTTSDANGIVTAEYWLQDTNYVGSIRLYAAVIKAPLDTAAKGINQVLVIKKK